VAEQEDDPIPVFVSYSHKDQRWLDRLLIHLAPLEKQFQIAMWADTKIRAGSQWREEIRVALKRTKIAVLLVSADFLASDFIRKHELPPLLTSAELEGATILSLIVSPCRFIRTQEISKFQAINSPDEPLLGVSEAEQERSFVKLAHAIEDLVLAERAARARAASKESHEVDPSSSPMRLEAHDVAHPKASSARKTIAFSVSDQFAIEPNDVTTVESFLDQRTWAGLLKIGNWILDEQGKRIIGAGTKTYLLSQQNYGADIFIIDTTLVFTNFTPPSKNKLGMNAGILFGWQYDREEPRYFNILLTGASVQLERCGFGGGRDTRDVQKLTDQIPLAISAGEPIRIIVEIDDSSLKVTANERAIFTMNRPEGVIGRVGIRPWRSNVEVSSFVVESF
jgi:hypothetical protein